MDLTCRGTLRGCMMRIAVLSPTGTTPSGADKLWVDDVFTEITLEPEVRNGDDLNLRNACGDDCVDFKDDDRIRWWNATLTLCSPNVELASILANFAKFTSGADTIGGKFPPLGVVNPSDGVSIEFWTIRLDDDGQNQDGTYGYYQWALPKTRGWRPTGRTVNNNPMTHQFVGRCYMNDNWGNGPANDWGTHDTTDSPILGPLATNTIPDGACGLQAIAAQT